MKRRKELLKDIPEPIKVLANRTAEEGGSLYIVGGWVRDRIMGEDCKDIDLATSLTPDKIKKVCEGLGTIYEYGEKFGTIGLKSGDYTFEITMLRSEEYKSGSRHPEVKPASSIMEDLKRRDFTINSLALCLHPDTGKLLDPFGGIKDIERGIIRAVGKPHERMVEDPLRMLRAIRFSAQLGLEIEEELVEILKDDANLLSGVSPERKRDELERILVSKEAGSGIRNLIETGICNFLIPEVSQMKGVEQPSAYHRASVLEHTILTMQEILPEPLLRRAALFHDIGKPQTKVTEPKLMFPEHEKVGEEITRRAMKRLKYSNEEIRKTAFLVRKHMRPIHYERKWSDAAVRRLIRDCTLIEGEVVLVSLEDFLALARADIRAGALEKVKYFLGLLSDLERRVTEIRKVQEVEKIRSPLDGRELMELTGRQPGKWIESVKKYLVELVISGVLEENDKEKAKIMALEFLDSQET